MTQQLFNFLLTIVENLAKFGNWLTTNIDVLNISPLGLFTIAGISTIIGFHVLRLVIGG